MTINFGYPHFLLAKKLIFDPHNFAVDSFIKNTESKQYEACSFTLNGASIQFRLAKITPKKIGAFATLWQRIGTGPTHPYNHSDPIDFFIIAVTSEQQFGLFIFPKYVLVNKGYVSTNTKRGKCAMRIYPPWVTAVSDQAKKTQKWQLPYFVQTHSDIDVSRLLLS